MKKYTIGIISEMAVYDRPKHKLEYRGADILTDIELMSVIIGSGTSKNSVEKISSMVLQILDNKSGIPEIEDLITIPGIGSSKAKMIIAFMELNRRRIVPQYKKIAAPSDVHPMLSHYDDRTQEYFFCITLNGAHEVINVHTVSQGILNSVIIHPREVFALAITDRSASIVIAHNHPSGNLEPSREDREITQRLQEAGTLMGIAVLDHVIFSKRGYHSFLEEGEI